MFTLRVKGKYIVLATALVLVLAGVLYTTAVRAYSMRELANLEKEWNADKYLQQMQDLYPNPEDTAREIYFSASEDGNGMPENQSNMVFIFPMGTMSSPLSPEDEGRLERAVDKLHLLREHFPDSEWAPHALASLAQIYYNVGDYERVEEYALAAIAEYDGDTGFATELLARMYLDRGDADKALSVVQESLQNHPGYFGLEMMHIQGRALLALGRWEEGETVFTEMATKATEIYSADPINDEEAIVRNTSHWEEISRRNLERIAVLRESDGQTGVISGSVRLGSKGLAGARVYLMDQTVPRTSFSTAEYRDMRQAVSETDGSFRFDGVIPGQYVLGVAVRIPDVQGYTLKGQQEFAVAASDTVEQVLQFTTIATIREPLGGEVVEGTVLFDWDDVEGAATYDLYVTSRYNGNTGGFGSALRFNITDSQVTINMDEELKNTRFYSSYGHSGGVLNPSSVFGQLFPGGEFAWSVTAFNDEHRRISDSTGYGSILGEEELPLFRLAGEMSAADELVWAREYDKAIAAYEENLKENPHDTHALLILARIHQFGVRFDEPDFAKAAHYYEQLLAVEDTLEARKALANVYSGLDRDQDAYDMYLSLLSTEAEDWQVHYNLAKAEFQLGRSVAALERLSSALSMEYGEYARVYPVALALVLGEEAKALDFAKRVDEGERYLDLLNQYVEKGYTVDDSFKQAIVAGDYAKAQSLLDTSEQDRFLNVLLLTLQGKGDFTAEPERLTREMKAGLHKDLLQSMYIYHF